MYKLIILCCILACAHAYTLKYFNCDAHKPTQRYAADSVCAKDETSESNETISYDLLQTLDFAEVPGFSCQLRVTRFFCVLWELQPQQIRENSGGRSC